MRLPLLIAVTTLTTVCLNYSLAQDSKDYSQNLRAPIAQELQQQVSRLSAEQQPASTPILHRSRTMQKIYRTLDQTIAAFYQDRDYAPLWLEASDNSNADSLATARYFTISSRASEAIGAISESFADGLDPNHYLLPEITHLKAKSEKSEDEIAPLYNIAALDIAITRGVARLTNDLLRGKLSRPIPSDVESKRLWVPLPQNLLITALLADHPQHFLKLLLPQDSNYQRLKAALSNYRNLARVQSWDKIETLKNISLGASSPTIRAVRHRLALLGDLSGGLPNESIYNPALQLALENFRQRHGLLPSPALSATTLAELNAPLTDRIDRLKVNLERWRWLPQEALTAPEVILVNIAGFELTAFEEGKVVLQLPTIVGKPYHMTPEFSAVIRSVEVNPYWNVPYSIAKNEILPALRKDSAYLQKNHMQIIDLYPDAGSDSPHIDLSRSRIRQLPGRWNALGALKFNLPNPYSIYLHDTPTKHLFAAAERAFSHGCIRVKHPERLALFLLKNKDTPWTLRRLNEEIAKGSNQVLKLLKPVPIHVIYTTAWVDQDGILNERHDIYGRDDQITLELGL